MADGRLTGTAALITGGASGIGAATVRRFVDEGSSVLIADLDAGAGAALVDELGPTTAFLPVDVSQESAMAAAVMETVDRFGRLDTLFNNAGFGGALGPISETTVDDFDLTFDVLLKSVFLGIKHASPVMTEQGSGSIVNTASVAALRPGYAPHLYTTAKAAVVALTETTALELAEHGVRCNAVCPGFVATPLAYGRPDATEAQLAEMRERVADSQPMGRMGEPSDIASMVAFLASDDAAWITGQRFVVDGGVSVGPRWNDVPSWFRTSRPIRHHRPPGR